MMIRTACLALIAAGSMLAAPAANAAISLNGRISSIVSGLQNNATFTPGNLSFSVNGQHVFSGIAGVRSLKDLRAINEWFVDVQGSEEPTGNYTFTHSALGSFFNAPQTNAAPQSEGSPQGGAEPQGSSNPPYKFTHNVLETYFDQPTGEPDCDDSHVEIAPPVVTAPVPEPATWAMMLGGMGVVGLSMRRRRTALSFV